MLDDGAFGTHRDGLGDQEIAVGLDVDVADKAQDALIGMRRCQRRTKQQGERNRDALQIGHDQAPERLTVGAAFDAASVWKKCSSYMPAACAITTSGKVWIAMLKSRTVPL